MKANDAREAAALLQQVNRFDEGLKRLNELDNGPFAHIVGQIGFSSEVGPGLTPGAARQIRSIMRSDYHAARAADIARLVELGVELESV